MSPIYFSQEIRLNEKKKTNLALGKKKQNPPKKIESTNSTHFMFKATKAPCLAKVKGLLWFSKNRQKGTTCI